MDEPTIADIRSDCQVQIPPPNQYPIYTGNLINVNYFRKLKRKKERTKEKNINQRNVFAAINVNRGDIIIKDKSFLMELTV